MVKVIFVSADGDRREVEAVEGQSLMRAAKANAVAGIVAECGGACMCATCHVRFDDEWLPKTGAKTVSELETLPYAIDVDENSRLSCQIKVTADMEGLVVLIPATQV